jgi:DNA-binding Lrp family transcriptional regulator
MELDRKDCMILNILQKNCRESLTSISKKVGLSVDSVNKRIKKMQRYNIFHPKIQLRPRNFGFRNIVDIKIKLRYDSKDSVDKFVKYLVAHPRVIEIFGNSGDSDLSIVVMAYDAIDLGKITNEIKYSYGNIINSWSETLTTNSYKFEEFDMLSLMKGQFEKKK